MNSTTTPSTSNQCSSLTANPMMLKFGEKTFYTSQTKTDLNLTQIQRWIWEEQLIEPKIQRLLQQVLATHNFLPCLILAHTFSMSTSPHIKTKSFLTLHPPLFFFSHTQKILSLDKPP
jgi:hypothetical protein